MIPISSFCPFCTANYYETLRTQVWKWIHRSHHPLWFTLQEELQASTYMEGFWICCDCFWKTTIIHSYGEQKENKGGKFCRKKFIEIIQNWQHLQLRWLPMHLHSCSQMKHSSTGQFHCQSNWICRTKGNFNFGKILPNTAPKCYGGKSYVSSSKNQIRPFFNLELGLHPSSTDIVETLNTLTQEGGNHTESCIIVKKS